MSTTTTRTPARQRKPRPKPERHIRLCVRPDNQAPGVLKIRVGKQQTLYFLSEVPSDFGRGFRLEKFGVMGPETYHVHLATDGRPTCECKGFLRWGRCKHADGLAALKRAGRL